MFRIIRAAFNQRRKTLLNSVGNAPDVAVEKSQLSSALDTMGLSQTIRGEALTLAQFAELTNLL